MKKFKIFGSIKTFYHKNKQHFVSKNFESHINLVSSSGDNNIKIWDLKSDNLIKKYKCDDWGFWCLLVVSSGEIVCSDRLNIKIWNRYLDTSKIIGSHTDWIKCLAYLPNTELLVSGSSDKTVKLWNLRGFCLKTFYGHESTINCLAFASNERLLSGSSDKKIKMWNLNDGKCLKTFEIHADGISCLLPLSPEFVISGSFDKAIKVWHINNVNSIKTFEGHTKRIIFILMLTNNELVTSSDDHLLKFWDITKSICIKTIKMPFISCLLLLPNGKLAMGFIDGKIQIWNLNSLKLEKKFKAHHAVVTSLACLN